MPMREIRQNVLLIVTLAIVAGLSSCNLPCVGNEQQKGKQRSKTTAPEMQKHKHDRVRPRRHEILEGIEDSEVRLMNS